MHDEEKVGLPLFNAAKREKLFSNLLCPEGLSP
jgi:hypothetical protein